MNEEEKRCPDDCMCREELDLGDPIEVEIRKPVGMIVSIRFEGEEFEVLGLAAERAGMTTTRYIKERVLAFARSEASAATSAATVTVNWNMGQAAG